MTQSSCPSESIANLSRLQNFKNDGGHLFAIRRCTSKAQGQQHYATEEQERSVLSLMHPQLLGSTLPEPNFLLVLLRIAKVLKTIIGFYLGYSALVDKFTF